MKNKYVAITVSVIFALLARLMYFTYRFRWHGMENIRAAEEKSGNYIYSFWHQDIFACLQSQTWRSYVIMVSQNRSADPIAVSGRIFGHKVVRGSSASRGRDKGGKQAKSNMVELLKAGNSGASSVDGPRGPFHVVKPGIVQMARDTGLPIIPFTAIGTRNWQFGSWDKARLPKPFTRINVYYGEPVWVPADTQGDAFADIQKRVADIAIALEEKHFKNNA